MTAVTIDGPSGAGKSTIAKELANRLGYEYLDTGAMYRYITLYLINKKIELTNKELVCGMIQKNGSLKNEFKLLNSETNMEIRSKQVTKNVSLVSSYDCVRHFLVKLQREISDNTNIVLDGRDIGSVVLPNAENKFYLTASEQERARRRYLQYKDSSTDTYEEILRDIKRRDAYDMNREISPLVIPNNAIIIDSTDLTIEATIDRMLSYITGENNAI